MLNTITGSSTDKITLSNEDLVYVAANPKRYEENKKTLENLLALNEAERKQLTKAKDLDAAIRKANGNVQKTEETLKNAENNALLTVSAAKKEAELIVSTAKAEADEIKRDNKTDRQATTKALRDAKALKDEQEVETQAVKSELEKQKRATKALADSKKTVASLARKLEAACKEVLDTIQ